MKAVFVLIFIQLITENIVCENPYRVVGMAPYNSMEEIRARCKKLVKTYHPDKFKGDKEEARYKFDRIQKACKEIKDSRSDEKDDESGFGSAFKKCLTSCLVSVVCILISYYFLLFTYRFLAFTLNFIITISVLFFVTDAFFAHYFESEEMQNMTVLLVALSLVSWKWLKNKIFGTGASNTNDNK